MIIPPPPPNVIVVDPADPFGARLIDAYADSDREWERPSEMDSIVFARAGSGRTPLTGALRFCPASSPRAWVSE